jgi:hypothetical protein
MPDQRNGSETPRQNPGDCCGSLWTGVQTTTFPAPSTRV